MPPHKSKSTSITSGEGQQNGADVAPPLRLLLLGRLRGFVGGRSAFYLSRQRHGAGMNQRHLHRHATAAVCGSCAPTKKTMPDKPPGTGFFIATHHPGVKGRLGRCAFCLLSPAHPACQATRGRAALLLSRSSCHASHPPQMAPQKH